MGRVYRVDEFLLSAQVMIENALADDGIRQAVAAYGVTEAKLLEAKELYKQTVLLHSAQKKEYGEQYQATVDLEKVWDEADEAYTKTVKIARMALSESTKAGAALMITTRKRQSVSGWIEQATVFYNNLLGDGELLGLMAGYAYDRAKLEAEFALVQKVNEQNVKQKNEMGQAQDATEKRDAKLDELARWVSDFRTVLKIALDKNPQWLEKVGILARSGKVYHKKESSEETPTTEPQPA